ncbi:hypothetical protein [Peribacillus frigoritolerans]|uniref:hypothetical protein n=1 Tax=Peribacillus frigoritolerans TaxID=450367 RepID=UPI000B2BF425|nr:hypothetical protein [Peribacillus frigoritolerans]MCK2021131.1 hypothetical protein [Peribacillus frigoritolerans]
MLNLPYERSLAWWNDVRAILGNGIGGNLMNRKWAYIIIAGIIAWYLHLRGLSND